MKLFQVVAAIPQASFSLTSSVSIKLRTYYVNSNKKYELANSQNPDQIQKFM